MVPSHPLQTGTSLPAVDDHLVTPETRYEMHGGELVHVCPADAPHATRHSKLAALLEAHTGLQFDVACDMLTRTSATDDQAPDCSVFPIDRNPETRGRQIEQLAFEVVATESLKHAGQKAARLVGRGVRRVFAIDIERSSLLEWSAILGTWSLVHPTGCIEDPALEVPLPVGALLDTARTDDVVAEALIRKRNPVIVQKLEESRAEGHAEGRTEGHAEGRAEGRAEGHAEAKVAALFAVLAARGIVLDEVTRAQISRDRDVERLDRWIVRAATCSTLAELRAER